MRIELDIEQVDIARIVRALDNQHAYTLTRNREDTGYKRLAELFRGFFKGQPTWLRDQMKVSPAKGSAGEQTTQTIIFLLPPPIFPTTLAA
jgi:hypothetical protein